MFFRGSWFYAAVITMISLPCPAQPINSWTKPGSGNWEEAAWSLGRLPVAGDRVRIENPGWKAVAIGPATAQNFPASLQMLDLTIASPVDSFNTLLLNFSGFTVPVAISGAFTVATNAAAEVSASALNANELIVDGTLRQAYNADVRSLLLHIGYQAWDAAYHMSNGVMRTERMIAEHRSSFNQYGGSTTISNLHMRNQGEWRLGGGVFIGSQVQIGHGSSASAFQSGGHAIWTNPFSSLSIGPNFGIGFYTMSGGILTAEDTRLGGSGSGTFTQTGGTNNSTTLFAISSIGASMYYLSNGVLRTANCWFGGNATIIQHGGVHQSEMLNVDGEENRYDSDLAGYQLHGGLVLTSNLQMQTAGFTQTGGSNLVAGDLVLRASRDFCRYTLQGGMLTTSNTTVGLRAAFHQSNGLHHVAQTLDLQGDRFNFLPVVYALSGGELRAVDINLGNGVFRHTGGTLRHTGVLALRDGRLETAPGFHELGRLLLEPHSPSFYGNLRSAIVFGGGATILRFRESAGLSWATNAVLPVEGWAGSTNGGGAHQLYFGTTAGGLTGQQLSQIVFVDPAGLRPGDYSARIVPSGEIVPGQTETLKFSREGNQWVLRWTAPWVLQRASEVTGFWEDVPEATSPFVIQPTKAREFYRLRR